MRVIAKVSCRYRILMSGTSQRSHHQRPQSPCLPASEPWLGFSQGERVATSHLEPIFLKAGLRPLSQRLQLGLAIFLPLPPQILNRHHILFCWDQLILYRCSAPVETAAVFSILKTAAFGRGAESYSVAVPNTVLNY